MELRVNDYVRIKGGYICKIVNVNEFREPDLTYGVEASYLNDIRFVGDTVIEKSSPNIIDLIEVGDYVNGKRINFIHKDIYDGEEWVADKGLENEATSQILLEEDIKSIVTKEQFEEMEYKI